MNKKLFISNIISDSIIFILMMFAVFYMLFGPRDPQALTANSYEAFKFFTVQSNVLMGIASLISLIYTLLKKDALWVHILKIVSATAVTLTLITVLVYLTPIYGFVPLIMGANLYMHLIIPVLAIIHIFLFEPKDEKVVFKFVYFTVLPMALYGIGYMINLIASNGYGTMENDWYAFGTYGLGIGILVYFIMLLITFGIGVGLYFGYKKIKLKAIHE